MTRKPEPSGPRPPLPGLVKVSLNWSFSNVSTAKAANILHVLVPTNLGSQTLSPAACASYAQAIQGVVVSDLIPSVCAQWSITSTTCTMLDGTGNQGSYVNTTAGGSAGNAMPPQCAVGITWRASTFWRGGKPRTYLPGVPLSAQVGSGSQQLTTSYCHTLAAGCDSFITGVNALPIAGGTGQLGMVSYYSKYAFRPVPLFFAFSSAVVHDRVDSQRRRSGKESTFPVSS